MNSQRKVRFTRDGVLFVTGLAGIIYETVVAHGDRPTLLVVFSAMCGLPAFLKVDATNGKPTVPPEPTPAPVPPEVAP